MNFLNGKPFDIYNPPWVLFPLIPLATLPEPEARILMFILGLASFLLSARAMGAKKFALIAVLLSPFVYISLLWGNTEWLTLLGLVAAQPVGIFLLLIKPQMTFGLILYEITRMKRETIARVGIAFGLSFLFFGLWIIKTVSYVQFHGSEMNWSLFPFSVPIGLGLLLWALKSGKRWAALAASPMLSPVLTPPIWSAEFVALSGFPLIVAMATLASWIVVVLKGVF